MKSIQIITITFAVTSACHAEEARVPNPIELEVLKASLGVWDAEIEVWPAGGDAEPVRGTGVETNRAYGEHWIASDFDSDFGGQKVHVHSIVGYDLDEAKLVGTVIDHGPYAAKMTGEYDVDSNSVHWTTKVKDPSGKPIVQKTLVTQKSPTERVLTLSVPGKDADEFIKCMQITFTKRK